MGNSASACVDRQQLLEVVAVEVPETMKRFVLNKPNAAGEVNMQIEVVPVPKPKSGEVLVRMIAAPVNPSDYGEWFNTTEGWPKVGHGKEGSGVVVASGGGFVANRMVGKKVGVVPQAAGKASAGVGTYQEYACLSAMMSCFPLAEECPVADGCSFFVNPYTAYGIMMTARNHGSPGVVHTGACSQLGQMLVKLCLAEKFPLINVVRRQEQADQLTALGAEHVVVSAGDDWQDQLAKKVCELGITVAFDCVAGEMSGQVMSCMPPSAATAAAKKRLTPGIVYVYGGLSGQAAAVHPLDLIYRKKQLIGFLVTDWIGSGANLGVLRRINQATSAVMPGLKDGWSTSQFLDVAPEDMMKTLLEMRKSGGFTNKKIRIRWVQ